MCDFQAKRGKEKEIIHSGLNENHLYSLIYLNICTQLVECLGMMKMNGLVRVLSLDATLEISRPKIILS